MSKLQVLAVTFMLVFPVTMFGDQIVLKNGDRLSGSIEKSDDKTLVMKTEFAGEVTVQWAAVNTTFGATSVPEQKSNQSLPT